MNGQFAKDVHAAWLLRVNFEIEDCLKQVAILKTGCRLPALDASVSELVESLKEESAQSKAELFFLLASLEQITGASENASRAISTLDDALKTIGHAPFFRWSYELGARAFQQGDFNRSLNHYFAASDLAPSKTQRIWALTNAVLCLENLGLNYSRTYADACRLLKEVPDDKEVSRPMSQFRALKMREAFREGQVGQAIALAKERDSAPDKLEQTDYFRYWICALPYHRHFDAKQREVLAEEFRQKAAFPNQGFRHRTLLGILNPEDQHVLRATEWADRLYLWVWRFLGEPEKFPAARIIEVLKKTDPFSIGTSITCEDVQLIRNSILWLGLFDRQVERALRRWVEVLDKAHPATYPIFQMEYLLLNYLFSVRDQKTVQAQDYLQSLEAHPLYRSKEVFWSALLKKSDKGVPDSLKSLQTKIRALEVPKVIGKTRIQVDVDATTILLASGAKKIISSPLVKALDILNRLGTVSSEDFLEHTFQIPQFDPILHQAKIFNLLSRARNLGATGLEFGMRQGMIFAHGNWDEFSFSRGAESQARLSESAGWSDWFRNREPAAQMGTTARRGVSVERAFEGKQALTRFELERALRRPRSTTNRLIKRWLDLGKISKSGASRSTVYRLVPNSRLEGKGL